MSRILVFLKGTQKAFYRIADPVLPAENTFLSQLLEKMPVRWFKGGKRTE
jgi:hypothetical protein